MTDATWSIVFSERLGAITDAEQQLATRFGAQLSIASLRTHDEILANAVTADILVVGAAEPITADALAALPQLRAVVRRGIGVDNVDVEAATALGIPVAYVPAATVEEVSDQALALALTLARRLPQVERSVRDGDVAEASRLGNTTKRFSEMTLGVVGFGRIGRALARKAGSVFGTVIAHDPMLASGPDESSGVQNVALETIWAEADVISLHVPNTPGTRAMVNADTLAAMKEGVVIVNTARGQLVDEDALIAAIESGHVAGAGLDVTTAEPLPVDSPLFGCPGILLTGHTASKGKLAAVTLRLTVIDAIAAAIEGHTPEHLANPGVVGTGNYRLAASAASPEGHR